MTGSDLEAAERGPLLTAGAVADLRGQLRVVADLAVAAITEEVPSYANALTGPMGENIREAVQLALGGFIELASPGRAADPGTPTASARHGAYQLGRGEARSGRSMDALLAAYRIGARVSWRELSATVVAHGLDAAQLASFAGLVFAYIDELSAASVAGHADELETSGRARQRLRERVAHLLLTGASAEAVQAAAQRAGWEPPRTLTAVVLPEAHARGVLSSVPAATLQSADELPGLGDDHVLLLVPNMDERMRAVLMRALRGRHAVAGPARPWLQVSESYDRAARARLLGLGGNPAAGVAPAADEAGDFASVDTEEHLAELVVQADPTALADLRERALAPLAGLREAPRAKLAETLRSWILHQGRRDDVAAALFVHPQTVRYRMGQLRELYGDKLDNPRTVLELTIALA